MAGIDNEIFLPYWRAPEYKIGSLGTIIGKSGKILKTHPNRAGGYYKFDIYVQGCRRKTIYVHRAVAETHLNNNQPIAAGYEVNHKFKDRTDNKSIDLEIITPLENQLHKHNGIRENLPF